MADAANSNSGANSGTETNSSGSWLADTFNSECDWLHVQGSYALLSPEQQETAQNAVGWVVGGNRATTTPNAPSPETPTPAPAPANLPFRRPAPTDQQLAYAALVCGYTAKDAPRQIDDAGLARYLGLPPNTIAARPDDFYRRWVIKDTRAALEGCTVLPHLIAQQPQIAPQLSPDIWSWKTAEDLFSGASHTLKEMAGGMVEPGLHMFTGLFAKPVSDVAGLAATGYDALFGTDDAGRAESFRQHVRNALTYEPRTEAGASKYNPLNSIPAWFGKALELALPEAPTDASTPGGMVTNGVREGIPQLLSIAGAKYIPSVPKAIRDEPLPQRPAAPKTLGPRAETPAPDKTVGPEPASPEPQTAPSETAPQAVLDFARTARLAEILQGTRLYQADPARFSQVVREMAAQGDMHTLHVPKAAFDQMAQGRGTTPDALLAQMPETQGNGGLLAVPAHEYFTALPEGMASDLSPFAKIDPGGSSLAEALEQARKTESETAETTGNGGTAKPQRWADTHPPLPPEQIKVPGGGLRAHEDLGGHALERHVGKTEQELLDRLIKEPNIPSSSSFYNEAVAEDAIASALKAHEAEIKAWVASGYKGKPPTIMTEMPYDVGITVTKGSTAARPARIVRVGIRAYPPAPDGYYIITGFPE